MIQVLHLHDSVTSFMNKHCSKIISDLKSVTVNCTGTFLETNPVIRGKSVSFEETTKVSLQLITLTKLEELFIDARTVLLKADFKWKEKFIRLYQNTLDKKTQYICHSLTNS
jgi:fructose-bisphosphate aldolase class 1